MFVLLLILFFDTSLSLRILQIVPGFTNSHVLFNYRLADTLRALGHDVRLWTQMEMNMVAAGDLRLPPNVTELRVPIHFKDALKVEGLKVFQTMMFNKGSAFDLWWTGQEFKDMRLEACEQMLTTDDSPLREELFDVAIGHFHDLCPLPMARKAGVKEVIWITHGTSVYDYTAVQIGLRTFPSFVPHPLSSYGDRMSFDDRLINFFWHLSTLDFVNLPQNLLHDENTMFQQKFSAISTENLWQMSQQVRVLLVNGERFLDFPRPLPTGITFMGEVGKKSSGTELPQKLKNIVDRAKKGFAIFSLGTVSNTTNMPAQMISSFVEAFGKLPDYEFIWRMEMDVPEAKRFSNIHFFKWLPQKDLMKHPKLRLLIAHGGYNSFLEAAQAGVPIFINAKRAQRFGIAEVLDKLSLTPDKVGSAVEKILGDSRSTMCLCFKKRKDRRNQSPEPKDSRQPSTSTSSRKKSAVSPDGLVLPATPKMPTLTKPNKSAEEMKRRLSEAQTKLGRKPNTMIVDLCLEKEHRDVTLEAAAVNVTQRSTLKSGDIAFPLSASARRKPKTPAKAKDEDTVNPLARTPIMKTAQSPAQEVNTYEEFHSDRMEEAPSSATFMYNGREIEYCARGLLRDYDNKEDIEKAYVAATSLSLQKTAWNPYAATGDLESRSAFKWHPLRVNTFYSNTEMAPTEEELAAARASLEATNRTTTKRQVTLLDTTVDITQFVSEAPETGGTQEVLTLAATPRSASQRTPASNIIEPTMGSEAASKKAHKATAKRVNGGNDVAKANK